MTKRVLFTASTYSHIKHFHLPYLRAFRQLGWEVHIACLGAPECCDDADACLDIPFEKKMTAPANFRAQRILREIMRENRYDLVTTHTALAAFFTRRAAAGIRNRPPIVNVCHGYLFDDGTNAIKRTLLLTAERMTAGQTGLLLTMNKCDLNIATENHLGRRIDFIPGIGVDFTDCSKADASAVRAKYGFKADDFVLLYAAEFSSRKNQAMLIRALPKLEARIKLLLPGSGALLEECRALAGSLGVADRVILPGYVDGMAPLYASADAAVSSSRSEGLPFNIMEAMHAGLPVAASRVKGHEDLLGDPSVGLLFPYDDVDAFCSTIQSLLDNPEKAAELGRNAKKAVGQYSLDRVLPTVMEKYLSVVAE